MLAAGVELLGEYQDSGFVAAPYLLRRGDGPVVAVSRVVYSLASRIDGRSGVGEIADGLSGELGRPLSADDISYLIAQKLAPHGIVSGQTQASHATQATSAPVLSIGPRRAILPQRTVDGLSAALSFLFWPPLVAVVVNGAVGFVVWLLFVHGLGANMAQVLAKPSTMVLAYALLALSASFHELGHAAAGHYGGARPGRIGVGLYLIWPAFFSDMTDSYRLSRDGRLRTDLGGVYFNAVFILVCAGAYALTGASEILIAIVLQTLLVASQFLPFLRLDGYYIVSDLIGVPDLFSKIRPVVAGLVLRRRAAATSGAELRPLARLLVTVWVMLTVPLLAAMVGFALWHLPAFASDLGRSAGLQAEQLVAAARRGDVILGALSAIQLGIVAVVPVGAVLTIGDATRRALRTVNSTHLHG